MSSIERAGSEGLGVEAAPASHDANFMCRIGSVNAGTGDTVNVGAGVDKAVKDSLMYGFASGATISCSVVPSRG